MIKINAVDMSELINRATLIQQFENNLRYLKKEKLGFWQDLCRKYKLDPEKTYKIDQRASTFELIK